MLPEKVFQLFPNGVTSAFLLELFIEEADGIRGTFDDIARPGVAHLWIIYQFFPEN